MDRFASFAGVGCDWQAQSDGPGAGRCRGRVCGAPRMQMPETHNARVGDPGSRCSSGVRGRRSCSFLRDRASWGLRSTLAGRLFDDPDAASRTTVIPRTHARRSGAPCYPNASTVPFPRRASPSRSGRRAWAAIPLSSKGSACRATATVHPDGRTRGAGPGSGRGCRPGWCRRYPQRKSASTPRGTRPPRPTSGTFRMAGLGTRCLERGVTKDRHTASGNCRSRCNRDDRYRIPPRCPR